MNITIPTFSGMTPKISSTSVDINRAVLAQDCRLRSSDLESFYSSSNVLTFNKGSVTSIYPMDRTGTYGGPYWLNWLSSEISSNGGVDVVRGPVLADVTERTYFTGAIDVVGGGTNPLTNYRPKVTSITKATTGSTGNGYPYAWNILGIPAPTSALTVTQTFDASVLTYRTIFDGSSLAGFTTLPNPQTAYQTVTVDGVVGNPAPSFKMFVVGSGPVINEYNPVQMYANFGLSSFGPQGVSFDFMITDAASTHPLVYEFNFFFGTDIIGAGYCLQFTTSDNSTPITNIGFGNTYGYATPTFTMRRFFPLTGNVVPGTFYNLKLQLVPVSTNLDGSLNYSVFVIVVNNSTLATIYNGYVGITTTPSTESFKLSGPYCGWTYQHRALNNTNPSSVNIDNVQQASLSDNVSYTATDWVYTYQNTSGDEGPPSPATSTYYIGPGITTTLTGFQNAPESDYGIDTINVYRTNTGTQGTSFQFNTSLPLATTTYTDTVANTALGEVLTTQLYDLPPTDGINIVTLPNGITLMSSGNSICPSVAYQPHAYPELYRLATEFPVIGMGSFDTTAVALTANATYLIVGSDPSSLSMVKISSVYGCASKKSIISWGNNSGSAYQAGNFGVMYATREGLVLANTYGATLVTKDFITKKEWTNYNPTTIVGALYEGMYYGTYLDTNNVRQGFLFDHDIGIVDLTLPASSLFSEHLKEILYYTSGSSLKSWDTDTTGLMPYSWSSKVFQLPYPTSLSACQVKGSPPNSYPSSCTISFYKDEGTSPYFTKVITNDSEFNLPPDICKEIQIKLSGTVDINSVQVAETMEELQ